MNNPSKPVIVWFRLDLRIADNLALIRACNTGSPVLPLFIWSPDEEGNWKPGAACRWWLHQSLLSLDADLKKRGSGLVIRKGSSLQVIEQLIDETDAGRVYWNRRWEPAIVERDSQIKERLIAAGLEVQTFNSSLLFEPEAIATAGGKPYQVFTPFYKSCLTRGAPRPPVASTARLKRPAGKVRSDSLESLELEPVIDWAGGIAKQWTPGETGASRRLSDFIDSAVTSYKNDRDIPCKPGVSQLSPHLHFGEISPNQIWYRLREFIESQANKENRNSAEFFMRELAWREFAHHVLFHFPETAQAPLRKQFSHFPWKKDPAKLKLWQKGKTGYPIVDAGMRELWQTGWMHNRVRMIVASFLTKDLMINWLHGAEWFWDTLVDADLANNTLGWQWAGGCGADAAPYFRIFNPVLQGKKFDPAGAYVRKWIPEISKLNARWIHEPWNAPQSELEAAGIDLAGNYPRPVVDHAEARKRALAALEDLKHTASV